MTTVFKPKIRNKKCKHTWKKLYNKFKISGLFRNISIEFDYLFCPKCKSTAGDEVIV